MMMMMMMLMAMTQVNVEVVQRPVIFPSVTICNKNHLDTLVVDKLDKLFDDAVGASEKATGHVQDFIRKYSEFSVKLTAFLKHSDNLSLMQYNYEIPEVPRFSLIITASLCCSKRGRISCVCFAEKLR